VRERERKRKGDKDRERESGRREGARLNILT
jgi:hypothetical protein